jgi:hypothetical protein
VEPLRSKSGGHERPVSVRGAKTRWRVRP